MQKFYHRLVAFVRSPLFFVCVLALFMVEAVWIALSARYPMAFDESYHLGIIQLYSHQISPLFAHQPAGPAPYGALIRDPSYLYHWLLSFPYRWLQGTTFKTQVIVLRLINVGFFAASLIVFRQALLRVKASAAVVHTTLFIFILVPVVPLLAGQINYDNLQILLLACVLLFTLQFREKLLVKKQLDITHLALLFVACLLGSLVKFTFLPFLAAVTIYLLYLLVTSHRLKLLKKLWAKAWPSLASWQRWGLGLALAVSIGLFVQMYGVNVVKYHNIIPQCGQVLTVKQCLSYGPWARNYLDAQMHTHLNPNPIIYTGVWLGGMFERAFFVINGPGQTANYQNHLLPIISITAIAVFAVGIILVIRYHRQIFKDNHALVMLLFVSSVYIAALWGRNYHDYLQLGQAVALNGRYLVPVILPFMLAIGLAYQRALAHRQQLKLLVGVVVLAGFLQGGGALSFIYASNNDWYWPGDTTVKNVNHTAQKIVKPLTLGHL